MKTPSARRPAFGKRTSRFGEGEGPRVERATIGSSPKKAFGGKKPFGAKRGDDAGFKGKRPFDKSPRPRSRFDDDAAPRKPRSFDRDDARPSRDFEDRPRRARSDAGEGFEGKRSFDKKPYGDKKSFGDRKPFGDKKPYGERKSFGDKKPYGDRDSSGERKSFGDRKPYGERKSFGDKKPYGERDSFGERKSFGDRKPYGERKSFGDRKPYGDKKPYGDRKSFGDKKSFGAKRDFSDRPFKGHRDSDAPRRSQPALEVSENGILLWGAHAVREAILNPQRSITTLWVTDTGRELVAEAMAKAAEAGLNRPDPVRVEKEDLEKILPRSSVHQGVVLDTSPLPELSLDDLLGRDEAPEILVILDQVTDPHNVGAILRSAAAFGASAVIVTERNAPNTTGLMAKTACGACEHVPLVPVINLARALNVLKEESYWIIGLAEEGTGDLSACKLGKGKIALVMGAEGDGLRRLTREHCDELARLPTGGAIGSLNVSNAAAVSLYEVRRQRQG